MTAPRRSPRSRRRGAQVGRLRESVRRLNRVWPLFLAELEAHRSQLFDQKRAELERDRVLDRDLDAEVGALLELADP